MIEKGTCASQILLCLCGEKEDAVIRLHEDDENKSKRSRGLGSDACAPLIATEPAGTRFCSLTFAKVLGSLQSKRKVSWC